MSAVPILFVLFMATFSIAVFVAFFRHRTILRPYFRSALAIAVALVAFEVALILSTAQALAVFPGFLLVVIAIRNFMISSVGLHFYDTGDLPLRHRFLQPRRYWWVACLGTVLFWVSFSVILFELTDARDIQDQVALSSWFTVALVTLIGVGEEIIFRLGMQNYLRHHMKQDGLPIVITSAIWSMAHWGVVDPNWVKMVQIFVPGLILGWLNVRYGILMPIAVHALYNGLLVVYS